MGRKILKMLFIIVLVITLLLLGARFAGYRIMKYPADVQSSMYPTISPGDIWLCRMKRGYSSIDLEKGMVILFP